MGYRSQVRSLIYGETDKMSAFIASQRIKHPKVWEAFKDHINIRDASIRVYRPHAGTDECAFADVDIMVIDLLGDDWKWYEGYDDVQAWEALLDSAVSANLDYEFLRLGEDDTDNEYRYNSDNYDQRMLHFRRSIDCEI